MCEFSLLSRDSPSFAGYCRLSLGQWKQVFGVSRADGSVEAQNGEKRIAATHGSCILRRRLLNLFGHILPMMPQPGG
jgi:hypothetical protein